MVIKRKFQRDEALMKIISDTPITKKKKNDVTQA